MYSEIEENFYYLKYFRCGQRAMEEYILTLATLISLLIESLF